MAGKKAVRTKKKVSKNVVAGVAGVHDDARHVEDAVPVLDRGAAEFLYDQAHWCYPSPLS